MSTNSNDRRYELLYFGLDIWIGCYGSVCYDWGLAYLYLSSDYSNVDLWQTMP